MTEHRLTKTPVMTISEKDTQLRYARAVCELADLLQAAAPLAKFLNSTGTPHIYRSKLRELIGRDTYGALVNDLHQMCSRRSWEMAHAKTSAVRRKSSKPPISGARVDRRGVTPRRRTTKR